jgi:hypothetical protein
MRYASNRNLRGFQYKFEVVRGDQKYNQLYHRMDFGGLWPQLTWNLYSH